jgi:hypothetical protein
MAIYHLTVKTGSRNGGQSARAKDEYIERTGSYAQKSKDVLKAESGYMPMWAKKSSNYWKAADEYERANGRLYKEIEFALPKELSSKDQVKVVREYVEHITSKERLPYSWAIHIDNPNNPHCHLIVSERINDGIERSAEQWFRRHDVKNIKGSGARKTESLKPKEWLQGIREDWATFCNYALERLGRVERIDSRNLKAQGLQLEAAIHVGVSATALEKKKLMTERGDRNRAVRSRNAKRETIKQLERELAIVEQEEERVAEERCIVSMPPIEPSTMVETSKKANYLQLKQGLAEQIHEKQKGLYAECQAAHEKLEEILEDEPKGLKEYLWESQAHKKWWKKVEEANAENLRLWIACGGDMNAPNKGAAEVERRLSMEYAVKEAEKALVEKVAEKLVDDRQPSAEVVKTKKQDVTPEPPAHVGESVLAVGDLVLYKLIGGTSQIKGQITKVGDAENTVTIRVSGGKDFKLSLSKGTVEKLALDQTQVTGRKIQKRDLDLGR